MGSVQVVVSLVATGPIKVSVRAENLTR